jgi:signal transduction histidine kinase
MEQMRRNAVWRDHVLPAWRGLGSTSQDGLVAAAVAVATSSVLLPDPRFLDGGPELVWPLLVVVVCAPLALRRRFPVAVAIVVPVATTAAAEVASRDVGYFAATVAIGSAAYHAGNRVWVLAAGSAAWTATFAVTGGGGVEPAALVMYAGLGLAPVAVGHALRLQADRGTDLARLERARSAADRAEERARIARDVHDVVGHHLSAIRLQAVGARRSRDGATADRTLSTIAGLSHQALTDIRQLLEVLRAEAPEPVEPGVEHLRELVRRLDRQGLRVHLGMAADAGSDLPAAPGACVVRIVGEALTNVLRHSEARHATVRIDRTADGLAVSVHDPGPARPPGPAGGDGIRGMRERAAALGGTLGAGPDGRGGWRVGAVVPCRPVVASGPEPR